MAKKKVNKKALVPELRFPEFRARAEWNEGPLSDLASPVKTRAKKVRSDDVLTLSAEQGIVRQTDYFGKQIAGKNLDRYLKIRKDDFVYNDRITSTSRFGTIRRLKDYSVGAVSPIYKCFRFPSNEAPVFWDHYFQAGAHESDLAEHVNEGARAGRFNISVDTLLSITVRYPSPDEQQKIADCLGSLDDLIAAHSAKLDALQDHKKGLLQQLFPATGNDLPALRFPGFRKSWKLGTLESLCSAKISYGIVQAGPHIPNGMPYIKSTDLNCELQLDVLQRTSDEVAKKYRRSEVVPGDIVFSLRGNIGVAQIVPEEIAVANLTQGTARIRTKGPTQFVFQALKSQPVHSRILAVSKGSTFQEISLEDLRKVKLFYPEEPEQRWIADCFAALDSSIVAQTEQITALKEHKKGLMQRLFPNPELSQA